MILEIVKLEIQPGFEQAFEDGARRAVPLFRDAAGCRSMKVQRSVENPQTYFVFIGWETIEDHTETFRSSPAFGQWRAIVSPYFAAAPEVQHAQMVVDGF